MSTADIGIRAATIVLVAICVMWVATFVAEAFGLTSLPALLTGALAAFSASDAYARLTERGIPGPRALPGPQR